MAVHPPVTGRKKMLDSGKVVRVKRLKSNINAMKLRISMISDQ